MSHHFLWLHFLSFSSHQFRRSWWRKHLIPWQSLRRSCLYHSTDWILQRFWLASELAEMLKSSSFTTGSSFSSAEKYMACLTDFKWISMSVEVLRGSYLPTFNLHLICISGSFNLKTARLGSFPKISSHWIVVQTNVRPKYGHYSMKYTWIQPHQFRQITIWSSWIHECSEFCDLHVARCIFYYLSLYLWEVVCIPQRCTNQSQLSVRLRPKLQGPPIPGYCT